MNNNIKLTVFTPTFNRSHLLSNLYASLTKQSYLDSFEWLIVDDGSTDNTQELINKLIITSPFEIRYYRTENGGKHRAINIGVEKARGDLFFIVDSDDEIAENGVKFCIDKGEEVKKVPNMAGFAALKAKFSGDVIIDKPLNSTFYDCSTIHYRYVLGIKGDIAEIYFTSILKQFPFPDIQGELFCSESLVWDKIGDVYQFRFYNEVIYYCEYLEDGLSYNSLKLRANNPQYARLNAYNLFNYNIPYKYKIRALINYWRFTFHGKIKTNRVSLKSPSILYSFCIPIGYLIYLNDKKKI